MGKYGNWYERRTAKGKMNYLTDDIFHPLIKGDNAYLFFTADKLMHLLIERDFNKWIKGFIQYDLIPSAVKIVKRRR